MKHHFGGLATASLILLLPGGSAAAPAPLAATQSTTDATATSGATADATATDATPTAATSSGSAPAAYRPLARYRWKGGRIAFPLRIAARTAGVSAFAVDRYGNRFQPGVALSPLLRVGMRLETTKPLARRIMLRLEYEHDLPTGSWTSGEPVDGVSLPDSESIDHSLRKAWGRVSLGRYLHLGGGFTTSHWGMGLLANDGAHGWKPGSARFSDPRGGDIVLRGLLGTGPHTPLRLVASVTGDKVWQDATLLDGDSAYQFIASAMLGYGLPNQGGFFIVHRRQTAADGRTLNVSAIDLAGRATFSVGRAKLTIEAEGAVIVGKTDLTASPEYPSSRVLQIGAAVRASLAFARAGGVLEIVYASGDQNAHDDGVNGFRADPNFETGLLLFRYVQAAQTGRGYRTATDPQLVGAPATGVERLPTKGGLTNAVVIFPRVWSRPVKGLEIYGGVLVALAPVKNVDPFNTRLAGGSPRNALDGEPGGYWGTEIDLGVRYRVLLRGTELEVGFEGGVLFPGSALRGPGGEKPEPAYGGRLMLGYRL